MVNCIIYPYQSVCVIHPKQYLLFGTSKTRFTVSFIKSNEN